MRENGFGPGDSILAVIFVLAVIAPVLVAVVLGHYDEKREPGVARDRALCEADGSHIYVRLRDEFACLAGKRP